MRVSYSYFNNTPQAYLFWFCQEMKLKLGGYFLWGINLQYNKIALSLDGLANLLESRGLIFDDRERVKRYLANIGYYRLSAYLLAFENPVENGKKRNHDLLPNTTFEQVLQIYIFDRSLRLLVMEAIERIEISLRAN